MERGRRLRDVVRYPNGEKVANFHIPADLDDYRTAYRGYLSDPDLQDARARWPFVPVWDNHEFNWRSYQSQQIINGEIRPAQTLKVAASQAWYEYQPARVRKPGARRRLRGAGGGKHSRSPSSMRAASGRSPTIWPRSRRCRSSGRSGTARTST